MLTNKIFNASALFLLVIFFVATHVSCKNMLGDNPERSFLGKFGLGSMPNSNFIRW